MKSAIEARPVPCVSDAAVEAKTGKTWQKRFPPLNTPSVSEGLSRYPNLQARALVFSSEEENGGPQLGSLIHVGWQGGPYISYPYER